MTLWAPLHASMRHWCRLVAESSAGAYAVERDGVLAAVVPLAPERSVVNCVTYERPGGLAAAYDEIESAYNAIGAQWTVWVHHGDRETATLLEQRGHVLDAEPEGMARSLADPPGRPELDDWTSEGSMEDVGALNDRAYDLAEDSFSRALSSIASDDAHVYVARVEGALAGCVVMVDHADNSDVEWVAVAPQARGRGLSGKLLALALADAAERGRRTSTLVATQLGRPVYERLGFRGLGSMQMWERRRAAT